MRGSALHKDVMIAFACLIALMASAATATIALDTSTWLGLLGVAIAVALAVGYALMTGRRIATAHAEGAREATAAASPGAALAALSMPALATGADGKITAVSAGFAPFAAARGLPADILGRPIAEITDVGVVGADTRVAIDAFEGGSVVTFHPIVDVAAREEAAAERIRLETMATVEKAIAEAETVLAAVARGEGDARMTARYAGALQRLASTVNEAADASSRTFSRVGEGVTSVVRTTGDVQQATKDLAARTEQQAASLEQTAAAMDEIAGTAKNAAENADRASKLASSARQSADNGGGIVASAIEAMGKIEDSSERITQIVGLIDDIAFQTNLLALNAAVEAARAGEAGKGFAVVASEVRSLASRTSQASKEIKGLIVNARASVSSGVELVRSTEQELSRIVGLVGELDGIMSEIAVASRQQAEGVAEVARAVSHMDGITQQNAAVVEKTGEALGDTHRKLVELETLLGRQAAPARAAVGAPAPVAAPMAASAAKPSAPAAKPAPAPAPKARAPFSSAPRAATAATPPAATSSAGARSMQDRLATTFPTAPKAKAAAGAGAAGAATALLVLDDEWEEF